MRAMPDMHALSLQAARAEGMCHYTTRTILSDAYIQMDFLFCLPKSLQKAMTF